MSDERLLKCPFCGGEAEFVGMFDEWDGRLYSVSCVHCTNCYAKAEVSELASADRCERKEMVINKWNNRKPVEDVLERLKRKINFLYNPNWNTAMEEAIEIIKGELL